MKHSATRTQDGDYEYRGHRIRKDEATPAGSFGRWRVGKDWTDSLKDAKRIVDKKLDDPLQDIATMTSKEIADAITEPEVPMEMLAIKDHINDALAGVVLSQIEGEPFNELMVNLSAARVIMQSIISKRI